MWTTVGDPLSPSPLQETRAHDANPATAIWGGACHRRGEQSAKQHGGFGLPIHTEAPSAVRGGDGAFTDGIIIGVGVDTSGQVYWDLEPEAVGALARD